MIDLHAHYIAPAYREALSQREIWLIGGIPVPEWSPDAAVAFMDAHRIRAQVLSVSDPGVDFLPAGGAAELARTCNDYAAGLRGERFGAFAVLSLQDPDAAREEAKRCLDHLGLEGVGLLSSSRGRYLGDPAFEPLLAELDARAAWTFVHPTAVGDDDKPAYAVPDFIAEYPFDTTRAFISLLFNGAFERHPNIRWHFAHAGGTVPMLRARLTALAGSAAEVGSFLGLPDGSSALDSRSADAALRRSYFDTALIADEPSLLAIQAAAGDERLVFGSDWPFAARMYADDREDPQPALSAVLGDRVRALVDVENARASFPGLAASEL